MHFYYSHYYMQTNSKTDAVIGFPSYKKAQFKDKIIHHMCKEFLKKGQVANKKQRAAFWL